MSEKENFIQNPFVSANDANKKVTRLHFAPSGTFEQLPESTIQVCRYNKTTNRWDLDTDFDNLLEDPENIFGRDTAPYYKFLVPSEIARYSWYDSWLKNCITPLNECPVIKFIADDEYSGYLVYVTSMGYNYFNGDDILRHYFEYKFVTTRRASIEQAQQICEKCKKFRAPTYKRIETKTK